MRMITWKFSMTRESLSKMRRTKWNRIWNNNRTSSRRWSILNLTRGKSLKKRSKLVLKIRRASYKEVRTLECKNYRGYHLQHEC